MSRNEGIGKAISVSNPFTQDGKVLISKIETTGDLKVDILKAVDLIGGFSKVISNGDRVLLKPNYNSSDPPPASSDPQFLKAIVELLLESGAGKVIVGESSWQGARCHSESNDANWNTCHAERYRRRDRLFRRRKIRKS
jgi:hypothetical protein